MKPKPEHLLLIDYFRGVAILAVFLTHSVTNALGMTFPPWQGWGHDWHIPKTLLLLFPITFGWAGVAIFFTVSGFCIHLSHMRSRESGYKTFYLRRFFRIYPPYMLAVLFFAGVFYITRLDFGFGTGNYAAFHEGMEQLANHFLMIQNLNRFTSGINGAYWSLGVEVQLYLLYPILLLMVRCLGWTRTLWLVGSMELGLRAIGGLLTILHPAMDPIYDLPMFYRGWPPYFWFSWAVGAVLADAYLKGEPLPFRNFPWYLWAILLVGCFFFKPLYQLQFPLAALASIYLMAHLLSRPTPSPSPQGWKKLALEHLRWAGIVSYSAYLLHGPFLTVVPRTMALLPSQYHVPHLVLFGLCLLSWIPIFGISYLFYRFVELPSINWGKRFIRLSQQRNLNPEDADLQPAP